MSETAQSPPEAEIKKAMEAFHKRLQDAGLKSTKQRDLITARFFELDKHISADELLEDVRKIQPRVGYATVYRTLKLLVEQGFAVPKNFGDGFTRYDPVPNQDPHHDHLICTLCRRVIEFNDQELSEQLEHRAQNMGFRLSRKKIELYAECTTPNCEHRKDS